MSAEDAAATPVEPELDGAVDDSGDAPVPGAESGPGPESAVSAPDPVVVFDFAASSPLSPAASHCVSTVLAAAPTLAHQLSLSSGRKLRASDGSAIRGPVGLVDDRTATWSVLDIGLSQRAALLISSECAVALADVLMGGPGKGSERALTELEERVLRRHLRTAIEAAGPRLAPIGITHASLEGHASFESATAALGGAEVLAVTLHFALDGEPLPGSLTLALPARQVLSGDDSPVPDATQTAAAALAEVPLTLMLRFPATQATAWDIECLEPGDVLRIDSASHRVLGFLRGDGEDVEVLSGSLGKRGTQRAVRIDSVKEAW